MASKPKASVGAKKAVPKATSKTTAKDSKVDENTTVAVELTDSTADTAGGPKHSFLSRLYTGTGAFEVVGRRNLWYGVSGAIMAIAVLAILIRGFTFGIDFKGGTTVSMPSDGAHGTVQVSQVQDVFKTAIGKDPEAVVTVGKGASATVQIRSEHLSNEQTEKLRNALFDAFGPKGSDGKPNKNAISDAAVSSTWGGQITKKAIIALAVFLALVAIYITVRYERYMTISALAAMIFDITVTAGVYALVGFEVTPATVIGLLTILGFSIYDTVIVFDKVEENTQGFQHTTRRTFAEQANLAVNQTFMRSINTSLISVLPVVALMVVAVWLLGVGTLKDLALVQLIGIIVGTYSSIFFATPLLVTLRERTELVRTHTKRVLRRRGAAPTAEKASADKASAEKASAEPEPSDDTAAEEVTRAVELTKPTAASKPAPGARPARPTGTRRPTGKRNAGKR
ncbi:protein translocase subunit SecF [Mycobacterium vicinigordonae]|uniref:Protein-export membrane protein SecF n=1 Tax=Mycobacterium vicinigordonae TaxID=1719132 RepID=A0A7D6HWT6_9MYCO|nr:protein translocase subunit SecF [Mycobacterium vicinigordonae]QLL09452.1 protein translocase subunit SecF [Mycobacterium vicinigordonae]